MDDDVSSCHRKGSKQNPSKGFDLQIPLNLINVIIISGSKGFGTIAFISDSLKNEEESDYCGASPSLTGA